MYFKQIEITGFKSFADRTIISLEEGMTSIVGPNGCGKSNILDAMRWALGEQSAKSLRGTHMQDIIFNGSEHRQPTGMAEVSLTFDNSDSTLPLDFAEVQVTRRIYRSGESEYLINKAPCRLRDIQELFMDTGIGTNAYSMIGQGKIGMVLSSRPEDRRMLFEEAAGIIKYKSRKRVAVRKLEQAEHNHLRLTDIIAEIERQMRSLKRQVNAAIRYRELTDQLRDLEIRASWLRHQHLSKEIGALREQFTGAQDAFETASAELTTLEARYEELSLQKLEVDRVLHARREGVHVIDTDMEKIEREIALIGQQIDFSVKQTERSETDREALLSQASATEQQLLEITQRNAALESEHAQSKTSLESKQAEFESAVRAMAHADTELESVRDKAVRAMSERAENRTTLETLNVNIANVDGQLETIYERQRVDVERHGQLRIQLETFRKGETELDAVFAELEARRKTSENTQTELSKEIVSVTDQRQSLREAKSSSHARLVSLRELRDSYEGFASGVRAIMQARQKLDNHVEGVIGPVGDLVSTDKEYERAVEAALGGSINNIVIEKAEMAKGAIAYLKERRAGRVTFLPLDTIRAGSRDDIDTVRDKPGVIGPAIDIAHFNSHVRTAMEYIFFNTVLVKTLDDALRIAQSGARYPRLVTLDGELVAASGAVTGGRTRHDGRGLLGRSAEIAELEEQLVKLDAEIGGLTKQGEQLTLSLEKVRNEAEELAGHESEKRSELAELTLEIARITSELENIRKTGEALNEERDAHIRRRDELQSELNKVLERDSAMESVDEALQREVAEAQERASQARESQSVMASELSDLRVQLTNLSKTLEESERTNERLQVEHDSAIVEAQRRMEAIKEFKENQKQLEHDTEAHIERSHALSETKEEARKTVIEAENQRQSLLDESDAVEKEVKKIRDHAGETQATVHKLEMDLRHNEDQLEFFNERIQEEYHIALSSLRAEDVGEDEHDDATRDKMVKETRQRLDRMGSVNLMAIEEYEALTERHDFLAGQEEDLRKAREALLSVIARIDETIKVMFLDTFNAVSDHFRQYFRQLFNGGQARIYLLDEDDPLECGIEIEARPPGKKLQTISLLSGGEQAMTAIALLFSLFKSRPSPFCILDEVDAPLDDANIGRFLSLVDEFSADTQFVVITHNKQTMARANVLYGVTMQERGVSTLVSVKFDGAKSLAEPAA